MLMIMVGVKVAMLVLLPELVAVAGVEVWVVWSEALLVVMVGVMRMVMPVLLRVVRMMVMRRMVALVVEVVVVASRRRGSFFPRGIPPTNVDYSFFFFPYLSFQSFAHSYNP